MKIFIAIYLIYTIGKILLAILQINYIKSAQSESSKILSKENWTNAANYAIEKEKLSIAGAFVELFVVCFWIFFALKELDLMIENSAIKAVVFINIFLLINYIFDLPLSLYEKFIIDEKYGFNRSTKADYFKDQIKTILISFLFGTIVIYMLSLFINNIQNWWIIAAIFLIFVIVLANIFFPIIRAKMFDKFTPLEGTELGNKIVDLLEKTGFKSSGVYSVDASKRDSRLNAYFAGIGSTKRVVLFDTLIDKLSQQELLAVLGHELGHFKHKDIYKNILIMSVMLFGFLAFFGNLPERFFDEIGLTNSAHIVMAIFLLFSTPLFFMVMPIFNAISRHNEFEADKFGGALVDKLSLKNALIKLVVENMKFPKSHPIYAVFYETHPNVITRIERLED